MFSLPEACGEEETDLPTQLGGRPALKACVVANVLLLLAEVDERWDSLSQRPNKIITAEKG